MGVGGLGAQKELRGVGECESKFDRNKSLFKLKTLVLFLWSFYLTFLLYINILLPV